MKTLKVLLLDILLILLLAVLPACSKEASTENLTNSQAIAQTINNIDTDANNANILKLTSDYNKGVTAIKLKIHSLSIDNSNNIIEELAICYSDFTTYTEYYKNCDNAFIESEKKLVTCNNYYEPKILALSNEFDIAYKKYPNAYTGSESTYNQEKISLENQILSAYKSYDLNMKYGDYRAANIAMQKINTYENQLNKLEQSWDEKQILDEIASEYDALVNAHESAKKNILNDASTIFNKYIPLITKIQEKYNA